MYVALTGRFQVYGWAPLLARNMCANLLRGRAEKGGGKRYPAASDCLSKRGTSAPRYFDPTTEHRYTSSVETSVISGCGPAAAAKTWSSDVN